MKRVLRDCVAFISHELVSIEDSRGEIVCWHRLDWLTNAAVCVEIDSLLRLAANDGAGAVRARIGL